MFFDEAERNIMSVYSDLLREYINGGRDSVAKTDFEALGKAAELLIDCYERGGTVFTAGNGGSGATASHMTNDLIKGCRALGRQGIRSVCLCDSTAVLTCLANDFSYEDALKIEFGTLARRGDMLVVYSGSGNSENVVRCALEAAVMGVGVIAFTGRDGGKLRDIASLSVIAPSDLMETIEDIHMSWEHALVYIIRGELERRWGIELIRRPPVQRDFKAAIFDFDGTVSLIRQGWQDVMQDYFMEMLRDTPAFLAASAMGREKEEEAELCGCVKGFINELTGKPTIYQCCRLDDEIALRGGERRDAEEYKAGYLARLMEKVDFRREGLRNGDIPPKKLTMPGFKAFADRLRGEGVRLYLVSGTDEQAVIAEAGLLGLDGVFNGGIFGARDDLTCPSKEYALQRITGDDNISVENIISFGDGCGETELIKDAGGYAVGVASDEAFSVEKAAGRHPADECRIDEYKRERLKAVGADAVIPDFTGCAERMFS